MTTAAIAVAGLVIAFLAYLIGKWVWFFLTLNRKDEHEQEYL